MSPERNRPTTIGSSRTPFEAGIVMTRSNEISPASGRATHLISSNDHWDTDLGTLGLGWQELAGDRNFARAYGRNKLKSRGSFSAVRKADLLHIDGEVTHLWNEPYNFENRQPGAVEARAGKRGHGRAIRLGKPIVTWGEIREEATR